MTTALGIDGAWLSVKVAFFVAAQGESERLVGQQLVGEAQTSRCLVFSVDVAVAGDPKTHMTLPIAWP